MTTLTFESAGISPRRSAARRKYRPALRVVVVENSQAALAALHARRGTARQSYRLGLIAVTAVTVALHAAIISAVNRRLPDEPVPPKAQPLTIEMAQPKQEPPPPPPVVRPKPLPQVAKPAPAPVRKATPQRVQPAPAVKETPVERAAPSEDSVRVATEPAAVQVPVPVAAPPAERVTQPRGYAGYLSNPAPAYPPAAQKRGLEGRVVLKVHVLANGQPDNITVFQSSGHTILDEAAIKAVTAWMFEPAKRGLTPIDGWVNVPLNFKLS